MRRRKKHERILNEYTLLYMSRLSEEVSRYTPQRERVRPGASHTRGELMILDTTRTRTTRMRVYGPVCVSTVTLLSKESIRARARASYKINPLRDCVYWWTTMSSTIPHTLTFVSRKLKCIMFDPSSFSIQSFVETRTMIRGALVTTNIRFAIFQSIPHRTLFVRQRHIARRTHILYSHADCSIAK